MKISSSTAHDPIFDRAHADIDDAQKLPPNFLTGVPEIYRARTRAIIDGVAKMKVATRTLSGGIPEPVLDNVAKRPLRESVDASGDGRIDNHEINRAIDAAQDTLRSARDSKAIEDAARMLYVLADDLRFVLSSPRGLLVDGRTVPINRGPPPPRRRP